LEILMHREGIPSFGEAERQAWSVVLDAIEQAIDIDALQPFDRARLAAMHERAAWHIGIAKLVIPTDWSAASRRDVIVGSGAVKELGPFGVDAQTLAALTYDARLVEIEMIERRTDAELLRIPRIGPKRLQAIPRGDRALPPAPPHQRDVTVHPAIVRSWLGPRGRDFQRARISMLENACYVNREGIRRAASSLRKLAVLYF
jgi:hypothetical protein